MSQSTFITLAIHTYEHAVALRDTLQAHGIDVHLDNVSDSEMKVTPAVRVRIPEEDLPLALKITESGMLPEEVPSRRTKRTLVPVDFSDASLAACRIAFRLSRQLGLKPMLLHTFAGPYFAGTLSMQPDLGVMEGEDPRAEMQDAEMTRDLQTQAVKQMNAFRKKLESLQSEGKIVQVPFTAQVREGVPEDVIRQICRTAPPALITMATRGSNKKKQEMVGSVTAEVLDSCHVPILTIPDNCTDSDVVGYKRVAFFCNLDQQDILSVDTLMRIFSFPDVTVTLVPVNERAGRMAGRKVSDLADYFNRNYPTARFIPKIFSPKDFRTDFESFMEKEKLQLLIVPNKKQNILKRLFNPGIAHRILFERDVPLLALPV